MHSIQFLVDKSLVLKRKINPTLHYITGTDRELSIYADVSKTPI